MDLARLRRETEADHTRTEAAVPLMAEDLSLAAYADVLSRMYGFLRGWELWANEHVPPDLRTILAERQRSPLIAGDLQVLRRPLPAAIATEFLTKSDRSAFLGAMYVMEGSTLGGQFLASHAAKHFGFHSGEGNSYFTGYGERTGSMWNSFKRILAELPESESEAVIGSAKEMFRRFETWMTKINDVPDEPSLETGRQTHG